MSNATPAFRGIIAPKQSKGPTGMTQQEMRKRSKGEFDMKKGGKTKSSGSKRRTPMSLAKEIRKEGEKWQDAVKRASAILKKKAK